MSFIKKVSVISQSTHTCYYRPQSASLQSGTLVLMRWICVSSYITSVYVHGPVFEKSLDKIYPGIITRRLKLQEQKPNAKHIRGAKREERKGTTPVRRFDGEEPRQAAHPDRVKSLCDLGNSRHHFVFCLQHHPQQKCLP